MGRARILLRSLVTLVTLAGASLPAAALTLFVIADTGDCNTEGAARVSAAIRAEPDWRQGLLLEAGDLAYPVSTRERLAECHEPHFGMFKKRLAVPGNHDWRDEQGRGFAALFPQPVPRIESLDARWQVWLLNSNLQDEAWRRQLSWLDERRPEAAGKCVIATWHHPRWSSGKHGDNEFVAPLWERLAGIATLTVHGHDHHYEALPPLDRNGKPAQVGARSFVVGTGGAVPYPARPATRSSTVVFGRWAYLRLDIEGKHYRWRAVDVDGEVIDAGRGNCLAPALSSGSPR